MVFEPGRVKLPDSSLVELAKTIDAFHVAEAAAVLVVGFSDTAGDPRFNERLAIGRAQTVQAVLVAFGIDPDKITAVGNHELGAARPSGLRAALRRPPECPNRRAHAGRQ